MSFAPSTFPEVQGIPVPSPAERRCIKCGYIATGRLRNGVCQHCRQRDVLKSLRGLYLMSEKGDDGSRAFQRQVKVTFRQLEELDGDVLAQFAKDEEIEQRMLSRSA